jgi:sugar O-acyltransferase (sialic acid O-acetyltransferase NeuD family)
VGLEPLVIVGAGGHGREVLDIVNALNDVAPVFHLLGFLDDEPGPWPLLDRRDTGVIGGMDALDDVDARYVIGLGSAEARRAVDARASAAGLKPATLVHPAATVGSDLRLGPGLVLAAGARITTKVTTGRHVHLNVNATLSHDCVVGDYGTLSPGTHVSGAVTLGPGVTLGSGAVVRQGVQVGAGTTVGAGAVVVRDLPAGVTAVGVPARPLES